MESVENQVTVLNLKIDALHQMVEQVNRKLAEVLKETAAASSKNSASSSAGSTIYSSHGRTAMDMAIEHKDVLVDQTHLDSAYQNGSKQMAPEVQIQRLTAQLTAAYNRIADLEEHLLSQRIHS